MILFPILSQHPLHGLVAALYAIAFALYLLSVKRPREGLRTAAFSALAAGVLGNAALIAQRWIDLGQPPFQSLFESMLFLALCLGMLGLALARLYRTPLVALLAIPAALGAFTFGLTQWNPNPILLPPALRSPWFIPHVVLYFAGYAFLCFAALLSAARLLSRRGEAAEAPGGFDFESTTLMAIRIGFACITFGLLIGSVWAKSAWGDYWVWDPKENWALATWLLYAAFLHLQRDPRWRGRRAAGLPLLGFALVLFTYLGMGLLPTAEDSAHVYLSEAADGDH